MTAWLVTGIGSGRARVRDGRVLALVADDETPRRLHTALGGQMTALACRTPSDVERAVSLELPDCVLVTPWDDSGRPSAAIVRRLRLRFPWLPIAVYCHLEARSVHEIAVLAQAGVDTVIIHGHDDPGRRLRDRLALAWSLRAAEEVLQVLGRWATPESAPILGYCLRHATEPLTVRAVADALSIDRSTLGHRLAAASLLAPRHLISWCRLLCAARWLEQPDRSVDQAALALRFGSGSALRNMFRRYTGMRPADVRARGGLACVLSLLVRELSGEEGATSSEPVVEERSAGGS
jgi:AraC-like DNA-binding protein